MTIQEEVVEEREEEKEQEEKREEERAVAVDITGSMKNILIALAIIFFGVVSLGMAFAFGDWVVEAILGIIFPAAGAATAVRGKL